MGWLLWIVIISFIPVFIRFDVTDRAVKDLQRRVEKLEGRE